VRFVADQVVTLEVRSAGDTGELKHAHHGLAGAARRQCLYFPPVAGLTFSGKPIQAVLIKE
jgi:hypothetical protein